MTSGGVGRPRTHRGARVGAGADGAAALAAAQCAGGGDRAAARGADSGATAREPQAAGTTAPQGSDAADAIAAAQERAEVERLRLQRNALFMLLLLGIGAALGIGAGIVVRLAPSWANPAQVALGTLGVHVGALAVLVPFVRRR